MRVTIKEWNAVATWRWDIPEDDVCGICQVHFDGTCPTCKYPGDDCSLSFEWTDQANDSASQGE
ncbi:Anaphase-promoting complex subunit 11 [Metarhizium anisopliae]|nr:Anaphase-promoting complex subunit 11 [Metarhizium anisopliae]